MEFQNVSYFPLERGSYMPIAARRTSFFLFGYYLAVLLLCYHHDFLVLYTLKHLVLHTVKGMSDPKVNEP